MKHKQFLQLGNILALLFALVANFLLGAQLLDLPSIKAVSDTYATSLTPAPYAFAIWSVIYTYLVVFVIYQARDIMKPRAQNDLPQKMGLLFIIASLCNGLWTYIFVKEWIGLSVVVLLVLTTCLYMLLWRLRIALDDVRPSRIVLVWWPLLIYTGWVTVAGVVNIASWLASMGITLPTLVSCLVIALLVRGLLWLLAKRQVRELLLASAWGITAVGVRQLEEGGDATVAITAFASGALLLIAVAIHAAQNWHANARTWQRWR